MYLGPCRIWDNLLSTYTTFLKNIRTCAYEGVRNVSFSESFPHALNGWSLVKQLFKKYHEKTLYHKLNNSYHQQIKTTDDLGDTNSGHTDDLINIKSSNFTKIYKSAFNILSAWFG